MATITDVSRLANVSKATVSRVLSGTRGVREDSRQAVLRAADELQYKPNAAAQALAGKASEYVGVILSSVDAGRISSYLPLIAKGLQKYSKHMLVHFAETREEQKALVNELGNGHCSAIILIGGKDADLQSDKLIHLDGVALDSPYSIGFNYSFAAESACRFLMSKGHRNIALIIDSNKDASSLKTVEGYKLALQNQALPFNRQLVVETNSNPEEAVMALLNSYTQFSAVVVMHDSHAAHAMRLFREFNLAVPQEVSIISIEDSELAGQLNPPLTCISFPSEQLVDESMRMLGELLNNRPTQVQEQEQRALSGRLISRESVSTHR